MGSLSQNDFFSLGFAMTLSDLEWPRDLISRVSLNAHPALD